MDDSAANASTRAQLRTTMERISIFLNFHRVYLHPTKTKYVTTAHHALPPAILTNDTWHTVGTEQADTPIRYLGIHFTLTLDWSHQISLIMKHTSLQLQQLRAKRASLPETVYTIQAALIPALLYKLKFTPTAYTLADEIDRRIIKAYERASKSAGGHALWSWLAPADTLGMNYRRLRERLLTEHQNMILLNLSRPHHDHEYTATRSLLGMHMRSTAHHVSPLFLPPKDRPLPLPEKRGLVHTIYTGLHAHCIQLTTRDAPVLLTGHATLDDPLANPPILPLLPSHARKTLGPSLLLHGLIRLADVATHDGTRLLLWQDLGRHINSQSTAPPAWYIELRQHLTHPSRERHLKRLVTTAVEPLPAHVDRTPLAQQLVSHITPTPSVPPEHLLPGHRQHLYQETTRITYHDGSADPTKGTCGYAAQITYSDSPHFVPPKRPGLACPEYHHHTTIGNSALNVNAYSSEIFSQIAGLATTPPHVELTMRIDNLSSITVTNKFASLPLRQQQTYTFH